MVRTPTWSTRRKMRFRSTCRTSRRREKKNHRRHRDSAVSVALVSSFTKVLFYAPRGARRKKRVVSRFPSHAQHHTHSHLRAFALLHSTPRLLMPGTLLGRRLLGSNRVAVLRLGAVAPRGEVQNLRRGQVRVHVGQEVHHGGHGRYLVHGVLFGVVLVEPAPGRVFVFVTRFVPLVRARRLVAQRAQVEAHRRGRAVRAREAPPADGVGAAPVASHGVVHEGFRRHRAGDLQEPLG
mmetsp:Transcript_15592/g.65743  ORF Transcript_15592/g.65743 Transcript_15592/m.65743 type:complete len:237 (+) Transcript_15592:825-1535(+)